MSRKSIKLYNREENNRNHHHKECDHGTKKCFPFGKWKCTKIECDECDGCDGCDECDECEQKLENSETCNIVNEVPAEDIADITDEKELQKKNRSPFKNGKALLIGINYTGTNSQLNGCVNDVYNIYAYLTQVEKFDPALVRILVDDEHAQLHTLPTKKNILNAIHWLTHDNPMGKDEKQVSLFLHYSGHGSWE